MATGYIVPLSGINERFAITLAGIAYNFQVIWRDDPCGMGGWFLDIADSAANPLVNGIPLVTGANLLAPYGYLGFSGGLFMETAQDLLAPPTFDNLGTDCLMYYVTDP